MEEFEILLVIDAMTGVLYFSSISISSVILQGHNFKNTAGFVESDVHVDNDGGNII